MKQRAPVRETLQVGKVYIYFDGKPYRVGLLNDCRARLDPLLRTKRVITDRLHDKTVTIRSTPASVSISPACQLPRVIVR